MYSFDGDFRRKPLQNLGGQESLSNDRDGVIRKAQEERKKRNELRKQNDGAIVLQSYTRSFLVRQRKKHMERQIFDEFFNANKNQIQDINLLAFLIKRIVFFYSKKNSKDIQRLVDICQNVIKNIGLIHINLMIDTLWIHRIKKLLFICLEQITIPNISHSIPLRIFEMFTVEKNVINIIGDSEKVLIYLEIIFKYLIKKNYFKIVRGILEDKCPPLDGIATKPPNQIIEAIFELVSRPLSLANKKETCSEYICESFSQYILNPPLSEPVQYFLIPQLGNMPNFPFSCVLKSITQKNDHDKKMYVDGLDENCDFKITTYLLYSLLILDKQHLEKLSKSGFVGEYIKIISYVSSNFVHLPKYMNKINNDNDYSSDSDTEEKETITISTLEKNCLYEIIEFLNEPKRVSSLVDNIDLIYNNFDTIYCICNICHNFMIYNRHAIYEYKLLYSLAFNQSFIRNLWYSIISESNKYGFSSPLSLLAKGVVPKLNSDIEKIIPPLATFCALFGRLMLTLHDSEFCQEDMITGINNNTMPFNILELISLSKTLKEISIGLVELAFPETRSSLTDHYRSVLGRSETNKMNSKQAKQVWSNLLKQVVSVLNQIYTRDLRKNFCPEGHWTVATLNLPLDRPSDLPLTRGTRRPRPFQPIRDFTREDFEHGPPISTKHIRSITILREIPFVVPFSTRVGILQGLIAADKLGVQGEYQGFLQGPSIQLMVRRSHLYEDAFDKLRPENEPDLRHRFRVQFISNLGLDEVGIDGGGVFREFLSELIRTSFDPNRGFFMVTTDNKLYPNPCIGEILPDFVKHYYFIGRILGKAIYENLLVELPLADFFLSKLAGKHSDVDVNQLASLDPELHKNLISLKAYEGDVSDLGLDFTVVTNDLGKTHIEELKPNGQTITVTTNNRIEYIQLMADYKLNKQIRQQCIAFRNGLANVLPVEWLYMFSNKELQILICGAEIPIDIEDLKKYCKYGGEYSPEHPTIQYFWAVVEELSDIQKRQLLKFVTSCSRPPLLGFKDLDPPFFIQNAGDDQRLPTASTCTNLLKLPAFKSIEQMREKLLYAIQSGAGFELS